MKARLRVSESKENMFSICRAGAGSRQSLNEKMKFSYKQQMVEKMKKEDVHREQAD